MIIERQLENNLLSSFNSIAELSSCQIIGSRDVADVGELLNQDESTTLIVIGTGFRSHNAFSLPMIDINVNVTVASRLEKDSTAENHEKAVEAIANKLSYWHFNGMQMEQHLSTQKFIAGELKMDGGSGRTIDQNNRTFTDSISFTIRGTEIFNN